MRASASFHPNDSVPSQSLLAHEEFGVCLGINIIRGEGEDQQRLGLLGDGVTGGLGLKKKFSMFQGRI